MPTLINRRIALARYGDNPYVICKMSSGWLVIGDALLAVTGAYRINYETWGNSEAALHTHITPRFLNEPYEKRKRPAGYSYDWKSARKFAPKLDSDFMEKMRSALGCSIE